MCDEVAAGEKITKTHREEVEAAVAPRQAFGEEEEGQRPRPWEQDSIRTWSFHQFSGKEIPLRDV